MITDMAFHTLKKYSLKTLTLPSVETILRNHISSVPNVIRIEYFGMDWNRQTRSLSVEFSCETTLGPIKESVKLEVVPHVRQP